MIDEIIVSVNIAVGKRSGKKSIARKIDQPCLGIYIRAGCTNDDFYIFNINAVASNMCNSDDLIVFSVFLVNDKLTSCIRNIGRRFINIFYHTEKKTQRLSQLK